MGIAFPGMLAPSEAMDWSILRYWLHLPTMRLRQILPPAEMSPRARGLTKHEAEYLLDCLENHGYEHCCVTYAEGEGFTVFA